MNDEHREHKLHRELMDMEADAEVCPICEKKLYDGRPVHGARHCHWDCLPPEVIGAQMPTMAEATAALNKLEGLIDKLKDIDR